MIRLKIKNPLPELKINIDRNIIFKIKRERRQAQRYSFLYFDIYR